jgi:hypothetical protein
MDLLSTILLFLLFDGVDSTASEKHSQLRRQVRAATIDGRNSSAYWTPSFPVTDRRMLRNNSPTRPLQYEGSGCAVQIRDAEKAASAASLVMSFIAFGDTPYDAKHPPLFEGSEYCCLKNTILPGIKSLSNKADFVWHVGDIKKGGANFSMHCTDEVFRSRQKLFTSVEDEIDFFIVPGDNEWLECDGYNPRPSPQYPDPVKPKWRQYFASDAFADFDHDRLASGERNINVRRQLSNPQNFFYYYKNAQIAFFGITESAADSRYDPVNIDWITSKLSQRNPRAIVILGHAKLPSAILKALEPYSGISILHVRGDAHAHCTRYVDKKKFPMLIEMIVASGRSAPYMVSIWNDSSTKRYFFQPRALPFRC